MGNDRQTKDCTSQSKRACFAHPNQRSYAFVAVSSVSLPSFSFYWKVRKKRDRWLKIPLRDRNYSQSRSSHPSSPSRPRFTCQLRLIRRIETSIIFGHKGRDYHRIGFDVPNVLFNRVALTGALHRRTFTRWSTAILSSLSLEPES